MAIGHGSAGKGHEFLRAISKFTQEQGKTSSANKAIRLGLVDYDYDPTDFLGGINPRILFDGESVVSQKRYSVMPPYYPIPGHRVCLLPVGTTYLIIGPVVTVPQDPKVDLFTSTDTWEKPAGARMIRIQVQGGGGGGGGVPTTSTSGAAAVGGGGGGGAYAESWISANGVPSSVTVTVGLGGAGGATGDGTAGGASSFGSLVAANGGNLGIGGTRNVGVQAAAGGAGGAATAGDLLIKGSDGGNGRVVNGSVVQDGWGGSSQLAGQKRGTSANSGASGTQGNLYGSGGSGAAAGTSQSAFAGGDGGDGIVIVTTYF